MKAARPLFSVLLPVHKGVGTVGAAVTSILSQSEKDLELLLLNDGSKDGSYEAAVAAAEGDPRFRPFRFRSRGLVPTLNDGLRRARGSYIARMDADDLAGQQRLALQRQAFEADPALGVVGGDLRVLGRPWRRHRFPLQHEDIRVAMLWDSPLVHPALAWRASVSRKFGGYLGSFPYAEDYALWAHWMRQGVRFRNLDAVLLRYRVHASQTSRILGAEYRVGAQRVRLAWLRGLGLRATAEEANLHEALARRDWPQGLTALQRVEAWMLKLRAANGRRRVFDVAALDRDLAARWTAALWGNRGLGPGLARLAKISPLSALPHPRPWKPWAARLGAWLPL